MTYVPWSEVEHLFVDRIAPIGGSPWCGNSLRTPESGTLAACASAVKSEQERVDRMRRHLPNCPAKHGLACFLCSIEGARD